MDLRNLKLTSKRPPREVDPIKIFNAHTLRGRIKTLFGPQQEALRLWHKLRAKNDVLLSATTGGGKTLIGLLMAQSLVNETQGRVLYLCATTQLVEQTQREAADFGMMVATYTPSRDSKWSNKDKYDAAECPCITNYYAAFNGKTIFKRDRVTAVILDDAHVAPTSIRGCFTIKVPRDHKAWRPLGELFRPYFERYFPSKTTFRVFNDTAEYEAGHLFVPFFLLQKKLPDVLTVLESEGIGEGDTQFAYEHLRDHLNRCTLLISQQRIEIAPAVLPTHVLPYFGPDVRRIYMTATLPSRYECIKTFGVDRAEPIVPEGIGTAQRLFAFPGTGDDDEKRTKAKKIIKNRKACIIVPSKATAEEWVDTGKLFERSETHDRILAFAQTATPEKLILAARYDGIDLPGDACNVLVLDGLPRGAFLVDQLFEETLAVRGLRQQSTALRITQAIGRIFRSSTDHGAVIVVDEVFRSWLRSPTNRAFLPAILQQQVQLGLRLQGHLGADDVTEYIKLIDQVVEGDEEWDEFYKREIKEMEATKPPKEEKWGDALARREYDAAKDLWEGRYRAAATGFSEIAAEVHDSNPGLAAWYLHMTGLAFHLDGDEDQATGFFVAAANLRSVLGRPEGVETTAPAATAKPTSQVGRFQEVAKTDWTTELKEVEALLSGDGGKDADGHEDGLMRLGLLLGFDASRPDEEEDKGPDVLWVLEDPPMALGFAMKTQKQEDSVYKKTQDIAHTSDCLEWIRKRYRKHEHRVALVGPKLRVVAQASPPDDLRIIPLEGFLDLLKRVRVAMKLMEAKKRKTGADTATIDALSSQGLLWPQCIEALPSFLAVDLQRSDDSEPDTVG